MSVTPSSNAVVSPTLIVAGAEVSSLMYPVSVKLEVPTW